MLKDDIFQMFICGTGAHLDYLLKNNLGGVIFFTHDISGAEQFKALITSIKTRAKTPAFLSIDQEGGRVERTENIHERLLSPMLAYKKGEVFLKNQTERMLNELKSYGINMNFAPCLDVNSNPQNPIIGERAFSDNTKEVINGFDTVYPIYKKMNIIPVIKHFPGHGDADKDSHKELPQINLSSREMEHTHILPFKHAIDKGAEAVMIAHLHSTFFDKDELPTSLSKNCINYLRNNLNFKGLTISDDMYMKGVAKYGMTEACLMGITSGINLFIYRDSSDETLEVIEGVLKSAEKNSDLKELIKASAKKISQTKVLHNITK